MWVLYIPLEHILFLQEGPLSRGNFSVAYSVQMGTARATFRVCHVTELGLPMTDGDKTGISPMRTEVEG